MLKKRMETDRCVAEICDDYGVTEEEKQEILKRCGKILRLAETDRKKALKREDNRSQDTSE